MPRENALQLAKNALGNVPGLLVITETLSQRFPDPTQPFPQVEIAFDRPYRIGGGEGIGTNNVSGLYVAVFVTKVDENENLSQILGTTIIEAYRELVKAGFLGADEIATSFTRQTLDDDIDYYVSEMDILDR